METSITTRSNTQIIQQAFNDFLSGNIAGILSICADDVVWGSYRNPDVPYAGTFFGKEGVQDFFKQIAHYVNYTSFQPKEFIGQGDMLVVLGHHAGTVKATGKSFDHNWAMSFKMKDGKLKQYFAYVDTRDHAVAFKQ